MHCVFDNGLERMTDSDNFKLKASVYSRFLRHPIRDGRLVIISGFRSPVTVLIQHSEHTTISMASTAPTAQTELLDQIFQGLKNKSAEVRLQSARDLRRYVSMLSYLTELSNFTICPGIDQSR